MLKKYLCTGVAAIMLTTVLSGCAGSNNTPDQSPSSEGTSVTNASSSASKPVKLTFLFGDPVMQDWFSTYHSKYIKGDNEENITVEVEYQKEANKILQVKAATGDLPDMVSAGLPQEMMDQEKFLDLSGESWWDDLVPAAKELSTDVKSGKNYYVPMCTGAVGIFYNKDIFNELGLKDALTWDEFVSNLKVIKEKKPDVAPFYICGKEAYTFGHLIDFMVDGVAKQKLGYVGFEKAANTNDLETLGWNSSPDGVVATFAQALTDINNNGLLNKNIVTASYDNQIEAFVTGKAGVISQGVWALADMQKKNPDFKAIGFAPYPALMKDSTALVGSPLDSYITISASSANIDAAKKVVNAMLAPDSVKSLCETRGAIPANPNVDANWSIIKDDVSKVLKSAVGVSFTQNLPGSFNGDERGRLVQELMVGKYAKATDFAAEYIKRWTEAYEAISK